MAKVSKSTIRNKLLKERGLATTKVGSHTKLYPTTNHHNHHTSFMKYLELKYGKGRSLEDMLLSGSLNQVCKMLGNEVDRSTISKWIKQLKLRYSESNLPVCEDCNYRQVACDSGICVLLIDRGQWELVELKKEELNG